MLSDMTHLSATWQRTAAAFVLLAAACGDSGRARAEGPILLRQPATSLVITAVNTEEATAPQPGSITQPKTVQTSGTQPRSAVVTPVETTRGSDCGPSIVPDYRCLCAPYCPKPMPCLDCCYKCCPDCYCPKPMPCPSPCYDCTCDDYCRKPYPCPFPKPLCGPTAPCRQSEPCPLYSPMPPRGPCMIP
jgi:hypothetical protein